jgi:hypothetical protein
VGTRVLAMVVIAADVRARIASFSQRVAVQIL